MQYKTIVNSTGQMVELCVPSGQVLPEGCTAAEYLNEAITATNGILHTPLRPRWDFESSAWLDDATPEELEAAYPAVVPEPSAEERIAALEDMMLEQLLGGV